MVSFVWNYNSPMTFTCTSCLSLPNEFVAVQLYPPSSSLVTFLRTKLVASSFVRFRSTFLSRVRNQITCGVGKPFASQSKCRVIPLTTENSCGLFILIVGLSEKRNGFGNLNEYLFNFCFFFLLICVLIIFLLCVIAIEGWRKGVRGQRIIFHDTETLCFVTKIFPLPHHPLLPSLLSKRSWVHPYRGCFKTETVSILTLFS